jgi:hypothetical protein
MSLPAYANPTSDQHAMSDEIDIERQLLRHEQDLMQLATRSSRKKLEAFLAEDFVEIGSAGNVYDRESVISALLLEQPVAWSIVSFKAREVTEGVALVTYIATKGDGQSALRSSLWRRDEGKWKMVFHQGTRILGEGAA